MNLTNLTTALFLVTSACGVVVEPSEDPAPTPGGPTFEEPPVGLGDDDEDEEPTMVPSPLLIEAPRAATTPGSLFAMSFAANSRIVDVVVPEQRSRIDVLEQKIVTATDEEVHLVLELAPPTGTYSRVLVSDAIQNGGTQADRVLCETNGFTTHDPRCEWATPASREQPSSGPITTSQWKLTVIDDVTRTPLAGCIDSGPNKLTCALPARAGASYRIMASAYGFADLWDGSAGFGPYIHVGVPFVGAFATQPEWQCWDFPTSGGNMYCGARYEFVRFTAIDRARLDFDPITVRITANGSATAMATPALSWDPGNDDVPGSTY